jgi:hypothetical protein
VERESGQDREKEREVVLRPGPDLYPLINEIKMYKVV